MYNDPLHNINLMMHVNVGRNVYYKPWSYKNNGLIQHMSVYIHILRRPTLIHFAVHLVVNFLPKTSALVYFVGWYTHILWSLILEWSSDRYSTQMSQSHRISVHDLLIPCHNFALRWMHVIWNHHIPHDCFTGIGEMQTIIDCINISVLLRKSLSDILFGDIITI